MALDIREIAYRRIRGEHAITFPLKHTGAGSVFDSASNHVLDIRGWGRLQYEKHGAQTHDDIADWVVETLNQAWDKAHE